MQITIAHTMPWSVRWVLSCAPHHLLQTQPLACILPSLLAPLSTPDYQCSHTQHWGGGKGRRARDRELSDEFQTQYWHVRQEVLLYTHTGENTMCTSSELSLPLVRWGGSQPEHGERRRAHCRSTVRTNACTSLHSVTERGSRTIRWLCLPE